jgi:hypothetical protein
MILDKTLLFSDAQAITVDAVSTNVIDLGVDRDLGQSDIDVFVQVSTAFDSAGEAATLVITLQTDNDEAFGSPTTLYQTGVITEAALAVVGYNPFKIKLPQTTERYLRLDFNNATEAFTAGALTAGLITGRHDARVYDAVTGV